MTTLPPSWRGLLVIEKPTGPSSRDVVNAVQRVISPEKVGHAGTLDPLASGVLVLCLGNATRLIQYVQRLPKEYVAEFELGVTSPTDDLEGALIREEQPRIPTQEALEGTLVQFLGLQAQVPPPYSAVRVRGTRAYRLARQNQPLELAPRTVEIDSLHLESYSYPRFTLRIGCGAGTYVRALGRDIARALGTTAVMATLIRTRVGPFDLRSALAWDADLDAATIREHLQPAIRAAACLPQWKLDAEICRHLLHGRPLDPHRSPLAAGTDQLPEAAICDPAGELVSIVEFRDGMWHPKLNFWPGDGPGEV